MLVVMAFGLTGGLLVGHQRWGEARARRAAESRERTLEAVAERAVRVERAAMARELHDVVSHAVGVIALQAAAGELSWPHEPAAARQAVDVIRATTADTMADLDRLAPSPHPTRRPWTTCSR